jgi:type I restriction enzyme, S subunit
MKGTPISININLKQRVFYNNLSTYLDLVNSYLSQQIGKEPLGKHIKVVGGYAFKSSEYKSEGVPVVRISDFQNEKIDLSNAVYYDDRDTYDRYQLLEGDIIIAMTGGTIGKLGIVQEGLGKLYLNQRVGKFEILKPNEFFDKYIYWLARGIQEKVKSFGYGGAQPNISGKQIEELKFPIPEISLQKQIVNFLEDLREGSLDKKEYFDMNTEKEILSLQSIGEHLFENGNKSVNEEYLLSKLRQAILSEAIQGKLVPQDPKDEPASILLEKIKKEKEKLIREGKIRKEKPLPKIEEGDVPYELPVGWVWCRLADVILNDIGGGTPSKAKSDYWNGNINWASVKDLNENIYLTKTQDRITELGLKNSSSNLIPKENLIICTRMGLGKIVINKIEIAINQDLRAIFLSEFVEKFYFYNFYKTLNFIHSGTTVSGIRREKLLATPFPLPPLPEQKIIVEKVDALMKMCDEFEKKIKENKEMAEKMMGAVLREAFES